MLKTIVVKEKYVRISFLSISKTSSEYEKRVVLEPMPSFERKIIHQALSNHQNIITTSEGKEPHRYVVISSK